MLTVPPLTAVTTPVDEFTVAIPVLAELHVPPVSPLLVKVAIAPVHSGEVPLTVPAFAFGFTVSILKEETGLPHPLFTVYVIFVVPALTAVTTPVPETTVATAGLVLLHVPPGVPSCINVVEAPIQSGSKPLTIPDETFGLTVNVLKADTGLPQPLLTV